MRNLVLRPPPDESKSLKKRQRRQWLEVEGRATHEKTLSTPDGEILHEQKVHKAVFEREANPTFLFSI